MLMHGFQALAAALHSSTRERVQLEGFRPAAVAAVLLQRADGLYVPLTVRSHQLRNHSGQVSLPGGRVDSQDESVVATAAREFEEELGISSECLEPLGLLSDVPVPTRFVITPVVFRATAPLPPYQPHRGEVAQVFEAPLASFSLEHREDLGQRVLAGLTQQLCAYQVGEHRVWGATARILGSLCTLVGGEV